MNTIIYTYLNILSEYLYFVHIYCIQNLLLSSDMVVKPNLSMVLGNDLVVNDFRNHNIFGIHSLQAIQYCIVTLGHLGGE